MSIPGPLIAHRGASAELPENTMAAIARAQAQGCSWVEIDVQVTGDGGVILMHDHELDRTTDLKGHVAMRTLSALRGARTRHPVTGTLTEEPVPLLSEALDFCAATGLGLVLEIKATWGLDAENAAAVAALLPDPVPFPLLVTSFSVPALQAFRTLRPHVGLGLACIRVPTDPGATAARLGLSAIHCNADCATATDIARVTDAGLQIAVATVNTQEKARAFLAMGAQGVMTDRPDLLVPA